MLSAASPNFRLLNLLHECALKAVRSLFEGGRQRGFVAAQDELHLRSQRMVRQLQPLSHQQGLHRMPAATSPPANRRQLVAAVRLSTHRERRVRSACPRTRCYYE